MTYLKIPFLLYFIFLLGLISPLKAETSADFETRFLNELNALRSEANCPTLTLDPKLKTLSAEWSERNALEQKSFHRSSSSLLDFLKKESYSFLSENLHNSTQGNDPAFVLQRWLNSPVHRKNLFEPKIKLMGITATQGKNGVWYVVWNGAAKNP